MFDKILIANRGEIACRVIRSARAMGVRTVAVYSDADASAMHVHMADQAVHIGASAPVESYLNIKAVVQAAVSTGAQAVHPGYGFLSENPDFVEAVEAAGLTFIGPSARAIRAMGLKDAAKSLMLKTGVPVVPGYHGAEQDPVRLVREADKIGYPVLIKAVAGGGGKGMRHVSDAAAFDGALRDAKSEARTAFGNDAVLIEKFIPHPRHIEIQVFGDGQRAVHLFERDCSLQRRHQKVIEEAPAPGMTEAMREAMGNAAVRAAEAIEYKGAGTVEFIVDGSGPLRPDGFWFMEMNTRLQVEHPVTEAITGVDLVAWQLRVAAGEPLPARQDELTITGHAIEARIYAEDATKGFLPATGQVSHLRSPLNARTDTGVRSGDTITPHYDPMIAKLITHGPNRDLALRNLRAALAGTHIAGTVTNLRFLSALADHEKFATGQFDTGLIERDLDQLIAAAEPTAEDWAVAALLAQGLLDRTEPELGFALWQPMSRTQVLRCGSDETPVMVQSLGPHLHRVTVDDDVVLVERVNDIWRVNGNAMPDSHMSGSHVTLFTQSGLCFEIPDLLQRETELSGQGDHIEAPMPGLVKAMFTQVGDVVHQGQRLLILEAMKMEHALLAPRDGKVAEVMTSEGAQVEANAALVRLQESKPETQDG